MLGSRQNLAGPTDSGIIALQDVYFCPEETLSWRPQGCHLQPLPTWGCDTPSCALLRGLEDRLIRASGFLLTVGNKFWDKWPDEHSWLIP